jgi:DNA repair protein RadA/Sms
VELGEGGKPVAAFGELGLTGELRPAVQPERRLAEAAKFGLGHVLHPGDGRTLRAALAEVLPGRLRSAA